MKRNAHFGRHKSALNIHCLSNSVVVRVLLNRQSDLKLEDVVFVTLHQCRMEWLIPYVPKCSNYKLREHHKYWFTEKCMAVYIWLL